LNPSTLEATPHQVGFSEESTGPFNLVVDEDIMKNIVRNTSNLSNMMVDEPGDSSEDKKYLTAKEFYYTMDLVDKKINSLYKLSKHVAEQQKQNSQLLKKLVALDELSDEFWNVRYLAFYFDFKYT
jgi:hypothetical protein